MACRTIVDSYGCEFVGGPRPWWQRLALGMLYYGRIRQVDAAVRRLLDARGILVNTLVAVTSNHGEGVGELNMICLRHYARTTYEVSTETAAAVEALADAGISEAGGDVPDDVAERLADLGYA